ncbi:MAG: alkaline phosphatase [Thermoguttaceae bacterium]
MLRKALALFWVILLVSLASTAWAEADRNKRHVIVMIADGSGFNTFDATSMYQGKWDASAGRGTQVYNGPQWKSLAVRTNPLNTSQKPLGTGRQDPAVVYDPAKAWDPKTGYEWLSASYTDSAAAGTALSTGKKTYNNAINWSDLNEPITPSMSELAKSLGLAAGVVTTVEWSHATPAAFSNAHSADRDQYADIARQMLEGGVLDVIMGAGNPDFDNNGQPWKPTKVKKTAAQKAAEEAKGITGEIAQEREYKYVGGKQAWQAIEAARNTPDGLYQGFRPVSTKAQFEALCQGHVPEKVLGTAQAATTLQQARTKAGDVLPDDDTPLNSNVPDLPTMTRGALNVLGRKPGGFFLMVEGGAVDWANHNNLPGRVFQEQIDFNRAVETVVAWVEANSNWDETLVVITSDHETGLLRGPDSDQDPRRPLVDNGPGKIPGLAYHSKKHSNCLVPVFARGRGAEKLDSLIVGTDPVLGPYIDNTGIAQVLQSALQSTAAVSAH